MKETISQNNTLKEEILKKIRTGEVHMRPKIYFILKLVLLVVVLLLTLSMSILLISYVFFSLKTGGQLFLLSFGVRGLYEFLIVFPWLLMLMIAVLLVILETLIKHFRFGYNKPIIYLFIVSLVVVTLLSSLINLTSFHKNMLQRAERNGLPFGFGFYDGLRKSNQESGVFRGTVLTIEGNTFLMKYVDIKQDDGGSTVKVIGTINSNIGGNLNIGDEVFVAGDFVNSEIHAYGIRKLTN